MAQSETGVKFLLVKDIREHLKQFPDTFAISCNKTGGFNIFDEEQEWVAILDFLIGGGDLDVFDEKDKAEKIKRASPYKYYCRVCEKVTDWQITEASDGLEEHKCLACEDTELFRTDPRRGG